MGVTVIPASRWETKNVPHNENNGYDMSTDKILESLHNIETRPEMAELDKLLMDSPA